MQWSTRVRFVQCDTQRIETARTWMPRVCWITWICKWICQESARRKQCGRGGFLLKSFMNEYKTKQQGTQVDTTLVGSRVHTHARSVFSTTRALFTQITNTITFENSHAFENSQYNLGPVLPEGPSLNFSPNFS